MLREEDPGPVMVRVPAVDAVIIEGNAELSVMVPVTEKTMSSEVDAAFASMIAWRRESGPESLLFNTVNVAGVILSSRLRSSSRWKISFLGFEKFLVLLIANRRRIKFESMVASPFE